MSPPRRRAAALLAILLCASCDAALESDEAAELSLPKESTFISFVFPEGASRAIYDVLIDNQATLPVMVHGTPMEHPAAVACHAEAVRPNRGRQEPMPFDERNQIVCHSSSPRGIARVALSLAGVEIGRHYGNNLTRRTFSIAARIDMDVRGNIFSTPDEVLAFQNHLGRKLLYAIHASSQKERTPDTIYSIEGMYFGTPGVSAVADFTLSAEILPRPEERRAPDAPPVAGECAVITCMLNGIYAKGRQLDRSLLCAFIDETDG